MGWIIMNKPSAARMVVQKTTLSTKMTIDAIQSRRTSHILGIPFSAPQSNTIFKRRN